ncbi:unnamed protein product, partial [Ectocarpus sp. 8 AP-2014]
MCASPPASLVRTSIIMPRYVSHPTLSLNVLLLFPDSPTPQPALRAPHQGRSRHHKCYNRNREEDQETRYCTTAVQHAVCNLSPPACESQSHPGQPGKTAGVRRSSYPPLKGKRQQQQNHFFLLFFFFFFFFASPAPS